jgi:hypothetical protein
MSEFHEGGCVCGAVRYRVRGAPLRATVCHCTFCQRRTGSAFAIEPGFNEQDLEIFGGPLATYEHISDETGRWLRLEFCPRCHTNIGLTVQRAPRVHFISGGTFDDPNWFKPDRHIFTRSAQRWVMIPPDVAQFEKHFGS